MNAFGYTKGTDGMTDMNGHTIDGGFSDNFNSPYDYIGGVDPKIKKPSGPNMSNEDHFIYSPKRTRWFNNVLRARERVNSPILNPNSKQNLNGPG
jgi:hypothetical protein